MKFTPEGGTIDITAVWVACPLDDMKLTKQCASLFFAVRDTGPGISEKNQKLLFGEGVQFDANRLQQGRGSGLGLYISKKIVDAHMGSIWAESEGEGTGSCFHVELPLVNFSAEKIETSTSRQLQLNKGPSFHRISSVDKSSLLNQQSSVSSLYSNNNVVIMVNTRKILVVDDAASNRKMVCRMLEMNEFLTSEAVDGADCLRIVQKYI